jgi:hypothetical protein
MRDGDERSMRGGNRGYSDAAFERRYSRSRNGDVVPRDEEGRFMSDDRGYGSARGGGGRDDVYAPDNGYGGYRSAGERDMERPWSGGELARGDYRARSEDDIYDDADYEDNRYSTRDLQRDVSRSGGRTYRGAGGGGRSGSGRHSVH